jgi:hypothetical protein
MIDLKNLEEIMKLMQKYQVDAFEMEDLKLSKKLHLGPKPPKNKIKAAPPVNMLSEEEIMFAASNAPKLSLDDFNKFAANPIKDK